MSQRWEVGVTHLSRLFIVSVNDIYCKKLLDFLDLIQSFKFTAKIIFFSYFNIFYPNVTKLGNVGNAIF